MAISNPSKRQETILSAGVVRSPHLLMLSGVGPIRELESALVECRHDVPPVDKHLKNWQETGRGLVSSSLYDGTVFFSTGLGEEHTYEAQIGFIPTRYDVWLVQNQLNEDTGILSDDIESELITDAENILLLACNCVPRTSVPQSDALARCSCPEFIVQTPGNAGRGR